MSTSLHWYLIVGAIGSGLQFVTYVAKREPVGMILSGVSLAWVITILANGG